MSEIMQYHPADQNTSAHYTIGDLVTVWISRMFSNTFLQCNCGGNSDAPCSHIRQLRGEE